MAAKISAVFILAVVANCEIVPSMDEMVKRQTCDVAPTRVDSANQQKIVDLHNQYRASEVSSGAVGLYAMFWDDALAQRAQAWANIIGPSTMSHGYTTLCDGTSLGQNIWWSSSSTADITSAVGSWYSEKSSYTFSSNTCSGVCGHYTQVVWNQSFKVGCGVYSSASKGTTVVCNYYNPGNMNSNPPYSISSSGPSISACMNTGVLPPVGYGTMLNSQNLCIFCSPGTGSGTNQCTCTACANGILNANSCGCSCTTGYTGTYCDTNCIDRSTYCNQWTQYCSQKSYSAFMGNNCPCYCMKNATTTLPYKCCS